MKTKLVTLGMLALLATPWMKAQNVQPATQTAATALTPLQVNTQKMNDMIAAQKVQEKGLDDEYKNAKRAYTTADDRLSKAQKTIKNDKDELVKRQAEQAVNTKTLSMDSIAPTIDQKTKEKLQKSLKKNSQAMDKLNSEWEASQNSLASLETDKASKSKVFDEVKQRRAKIEAQNKADLKVLKTQQKELEKAEKAANGSH